MKHMVRLQDIVGCVPDTRSIENPTLADSGYPDQSPHCVVSDLDLLCLPMSHKKDVKSVKY